MSHITMEKFRKVLGGSKEEIIHSMKTMLSSDDYDQIIQQAWNGLQEVLYEQEVESARGITEAQNASGSDSESVSSDTDDDPTTVPFMYEAIQVDGKPISYDCHIDSDYNRRARSKVANMSILERSAVVKSYNLPHEFAELLFENPHNSNVKRTERSGCFHYFNGTNWVRKGTGDVYEIVKVWGEKAREFYGLLARQHGSEWTQSFEGFYASLVLKMFDYDHPCCSKILKTLDTHAKRCALMTIDAANDSVRLIKSRTGKKMKRVLSEGDFRGKKIMRETTWAELMRV